MGKNIVERNPNNGKKSVYHINSNYFLNATVAAKSLYTYIPVMHITSLLDKYQYMCNLEYHEEDQNPLLSCQTSTAQTCSEEKHQGAPLSYGFSSLT